MKAQHDNAELIDHFTPEDYSRIADEIQRRFFDYLDAPVRVVASKDVSNPVSKVMESEAILDTGEIITALMQT